MAFKDRKGSSSTENSPTLKGFYQEYQGHNLVFKYVFAAFVIISIVIFALLAWGVIREEKRIDDLEDEVDNLTTNQVHQGADINSVKKKADDNAKDVEGLKAVASKHKKRLDRIVNKVRDKLDIDDFTSTLKDAFKVTNIKNYGICFNMADPATQNGCETPGDCACPIGSSQQCQSIFAFGEPSGGSNNGNCSFLNSKGCCGFASLIPDSETCLIDYGSDAWERVDLEEKTLFIPCPYTDYLIDIYLPSIEYALGDLTQEQLSRMKMYIGGGYEQPADNSRTVIYPNIEVGGFGATFFDGNNSLDYSSEQGSLGPFHFSLIIPAQGPCSPSSMVFWPVLNILYPEEIKAPLWFGSSSGETAYMIAYEMGTTQPPSLSPSRTPSVSLTPSHSHTPDVSPSPTPSVPPSPVVQPTTDFPATMRALGAAQSFYNCVDEKCDKPQTLFQFPHIFGYEMAFPKGQNDPSCIACNQTITSSCNSCCGWLTNPSLVPRGLGLIDYGSHFFVPCPNREYVASVTLDGAFWNFTGEGGDPWLDEYLLSVGGTSSFQSENVFPPNNVSGPTVPLISFNNASWATKDTPFTNSFVISSQPTDYTKRIAFFPMMSLLSRVNTKESLNSVITLPRLEFFYSTGNVTVDMTSREEDQSTTDPFFFNRAFNFDAMGINNMQDVASIDGVNQPPDFTNVLRFDYFIARDNLKCNCSVDRSIDPTGCDLCCGWVTSRYTKGVDGGFPLKGVSGLPNDTLMAFVPCPGVGYEITVSLSSFETGTTTSSTLTMGAPSGKYMPGEFAVGGYNVTIMDLPVDRTNDPIPISPPPVTFSIMGEDSSVPFEDRKYFVPALFLSDFETFDAYVNFIADDSFGGSILVRPIL